MSEDTTEKTNEDHSSVVAAAVATVASAGIGMAARSALKFAYRKTSGHDAPDPQNLSTPFSKALVWTLLTTVTAGVIELAAYRVVTRLMNKEQSA